jgi:hypothetical protein
MDDKTPIDLTAGAVAFGSLFDMLPAVASLFTIVWLGFRIWETETVKKWTNRE